MSCELKNNSNFVFIAAKYFFNFAHPKQIFDTFRIKQSFYFFAYVDNHYHSRSFGYLFCKR